MNGDNHGIVLLTLNRPKSKNALGRQIISEFQQHVKQLADDGSARVIIINSNVDGVFCAGADLKERQSMKTDEEIYEFVNELRAAFSALEVLFVYLF